MQVKYSAEIKGVHNLVFGYFTDFRKLPERLSTVTKTEVLTEGPTKVGTRYRETRKMFGKEHTEEMRVVEYTDKKEFMVEANPTGIRYLTRFRFEPMGEKTRVSVEFKGIPESRLSRLITPIMGLLMRGTMKRCFEKDFQEFDRLNGGFTQ